jgi:outer membrane immunogenic protein
VLLATIGMSALLLMGAAQAAAPIVPPAFNWSSFYIGGHVGYQWTHVETNAFNGVGTPIDSTTNDLSGILGGGQVGYNWVFMPGWLLGVEADISGADITGSGSSCTATRCASHLTKIDQLATVRARLGYLWNNWLLYGTGGWAFSHSSTQVTVTCVVAGGGICPGGPSPSSLTGKVASASGSQSGWAGGAGFERPLGTIVPLLPGHWTFKFEYMHTQFDNVVRDFNYPKFPAAFRHDVSTSSSDQIRFGMNYVFN